METASRMAKNQPIFQVVSEYLKFPFELKVDYFILYSVLASTFVIFLPFLV